MKNLLLNAKLIKLADECLLVLSQTQNKWFMTNITNKTVLKMMDGRHSSNEILTANPFLTERKLDKLIATLRELNMLCINSCECNNKTHNNIKCHKNYPTHVVINLTDQCNLNCLYCYVDSSPTRSNYMKPEIAIKIASELINMNSDNEEILTVVFHGGEPTLNLNAIRAFCEYIIPYRDRFDLCIQTNGTNISDEFIKLVKKYSINIGLSIDGYKKLHDATRIDIKGKGSFDSLEKGIKVLKEEGISFGILTVLNRYNYKYTREIIDYFSSIGAKNCAFLRLTEIGRENSHPELLITGEEIFESFCNIIDWLIEYNNNNEIPFEERTISKMVKIISGGKRDYMCMRKPCGAGRDTIGIDTQGGVYPCDDMVGISKFYMGNLMESNLKSIIDNTNVLDIIDTSNNKLNMECSDCSWKSLCSEVCSAQYYSSPHETVLDEPECQFHQKLIPELLKRYFKDPTVFKLLCRDLRGYEKKEFYFNITYTCNSHCIFCAADHDISPINNIITLDMMKDLITFHQIQAGDIVVLNGGEPTTNPEFINIISLFSEKKISTIAYSNGRNLSNYNYCRKLIEAGLNKISIPIFGFNSETHDYCTGVKNSFEETIAGIQNIIELRKKLCSNIIIEIKLLYIKYLLDTNPEIIRWLINKFPSIDIISVNSLIVSDTVMLRKEELIPNFETWSDSLNKTLMVAKECDITDKIELNDTPYCLINDHNYDFLEDYIVRDGSYLADIKTSTYIDYDNLNGQKNTPITIEDDNICVECVMYKKCKFFNRIYGNPNVAIESLKILS